MSTRRRSTYVIVIAVICVASTQIGAGHLTTEVVDSHAFLQRSLVPAGAAPAVLSAALEQNLRQMTLREKIGQMTQFAIGMITDGSGQYVRINPEKLYKAIDQYGVESIFNVNDEASPVQKWQEIVRAIQAERVRRGCTFPFSMVLTRCTVLTTLRAARSFLSRWRSCR